MVKQFKYAKNQFLGIGIILLVLLAAVVYTRRYREGFQAAPDLSKYFIGSRLVWATDAAIKAAFGSPSSTSTIEIGKFPDFDTPVLSASVNTLSSDNTTKNVYSIKDTAQSANPPAATTIALADIGQPIPESKSGFPIILNQYMLFGPTETPSALSFPSDRPMFPISFLGMRVNSSDALLKSFITASASSGGPPPIIKDAVTSAVISTDKLTTSTTKKDYDLIMDPTGSMPADPQVVDIAQIGKPFDPTGVDKETILKNYILKDNTTNTTFYQPALATAAASTTTTTTTAATKTTVGTSTVAKKDEGLSTGAIVGIAIVATAVVGGGIYFAVRQTSAPAPSPY